VQRGHGGEVSGVARSVRKWNWRNTEKDSRRVTLFQLITEWYSNGLWKSVRMLGSDSQPKMKGSNKKKDPWFGFAHHRLLAKVARMGHPNPS